MTTQDPYAAILKVEEARLKELEASIEKALAERDRQRDFVEQVRARAGSSSPPRATPKNGRPKRVGDTAATSSGSRNAPSWADRLNGVFDARPGEWLTARQLVESLKASGAPFDDLSKRPDVIVRSAIKGGFRKHGYVRRETQDGIKFSRDLGKAAAT